MKITTVLLLAMTPVSFAHRLAHQARLQTDVRLANLTVQFRFGNQGSDRVDDNYIDRVALDQVLGDLHGFFTRAGLADQQSVQLNTDLLGPTWIEGMLGVDDGRDTSGGLCLPANVECERRLAAGLGPEDFDDASARHALTAQSDVQERLPVRTPSIFSVPSPPRGMIEPSPNCFSICCRAVLRPGSFL